MGFFLPVTNNYVGSTESAGAPSGVSGARAPIYPVVWNPVKQRSESDDPNFAGYNRSGVLNVPRNGNALINSAFLPAATTSGGVAALATPATVAQGSVGLPSIFSSMDPTKPANQQFTPNPNAAVVPTPVSAGSTPVYPLNVPAAGGVSGVAIPKSQVVNDQTNAMFGDLNNLKTQVSGVLADFNKQFPDFLAGQKATATQENTATAGVWNGTAQDKVNADVANFLANNNAASNKAIADFHRLHSRSNIATGAGDSSAADNTERAQIINARAQAALEASKAQMAGDQWLTQLQQTYAGAQAARNRLTIGDTLLPATVGEGQLSTFAQILASLAGTTNLNNTTGVVGPGGFVANDFTSLQNAKLADLARQMDYLKMLSGNQNANSQLDFQYDALNNNTALAQAGLLRPSTVENRYNAIGR